MSKIVLIACVSQKLNKRAKVKDIYTSPLFIYSLAYANTLKPDRIFILSALYHLLELETEIEPYDITLSLVPKLKRKQGIVVLSPVEKKEWGKTVVEMLSKQADLQCDQFIVLAGREYIKPILPYLSNLDDRLKGMSIGKRLSFLKSQVKCSQ